MINIKLDKYSAEDVKAIQLLREFGYSDEEIQRLYDRQKEKDEQTMTIEKANDLLTGTGAYIYKRDGVYHWVMVQDMSRNGYATVEEAYNDACRFISTKY